MPAKLSPLPPDVHLETYLAGSYPDLDLLSLLENLPEEDDSLPLEINASYGAISAALDRYRCNPHFNHLILAYDEQNQVIGAATIDANPHARHRCLWLLGSSRPGQGIGRALVDSAASLIPEECTLTCSPILMSEGFWKHLGFAETSTGMWEPTTPTRSHRQL